MRPSNSPTFLCSRPRDDDYERVRSRSIHDIGPDSPFEVSALMIKSPVTGSCWRDGRGERKSCSRAKYLDEHIVNTNSSREVSRREYFDVPCFPRPSANEGLRVLAPGLDQNTKPIPSFEGSILVGYRSILQQLQDGLPMATVDQERERENQRL